MKNTFLGLIIRNKNYKEEKFINNFITTKNIKGVESEKCVLVQKFIFSLPPDNEKYP